MTTQSIFQIDSFHRFQNDSSHWYQIQLGHTHRQQVRKIVRRVSKHLKFNIREIAYPSTVRDTHGGTIIPRIIANMKRWVLNDTIIINSISHCTLSRWILVLFFLVLILDCFFPLHFIQVMHCFFIRIFYTVVDRTAVQTDDGRF